MRSLSRREAVAGRIRVSLALSVRAYGPSWDDSDTDVPTISDFRASDAAESGGGHSRPEQAASALVQR